MSSSGKPPSKIAMIEAITELNSFSKLYCVVRKVKTSKHISRVFCLMLFLFGVVNLTGEINMLSTINSLLSYSSSAINWSVAILGFILAGYSIYSTLTDKELNLALATVKHPSYKISYLAYTHAVFVKVIIEITAICLFSFIVQVIADSPLMESIVKEGSVANYTLYFCILVLTVVQALFVYVLMSCLVFIYNVYHSIMTSVRWFAENKTDDS